VNDIKQNRAVGKDRKTLEGLYDKLRLYSRQDYYPMHMPGHKRNTQLLKEGNPYAIDITEIEGFDNLHQPEGVIKQLLERICCLYHAKKSYCLVNGSTGGILAGISAAVNRGDKILVARNCHKSVYHAMLLMELNPVYVYPEQVGEFSINGGILPEKIEELLIKYPEIRLVVITSPTYEGVVSDISRIVSIVHGHGALLLVDEAHGAHFGFHESFPKSAVSFGADIVIQSLHKTLPAFTQTGVLHCNRPQLNRRLEQYLDIYQTSSPSYLLMAGIDRCIRLLEDQGDAFFASYYGKLTDFYQSMQKLKRLKLVTGKLAGRYGICSLDPSKITISVKNTGLTGHQLYEVLQDKYHIVLEMAARDYVLAMTSICDTEDGFERLAGALLAIDIDLDHVCQKEALIDEAAVDYKELQPVKVLAPYEAMDKSSETVMLTCSPGRVSDTMICLFPPGSPLLVPGERIEENLVAYIRQAKKEGLTVSGLCGQEQGEIEVVSDKRKG
jgi:arginine decarboxylase